MLTLWDGEVSYAIAECGMLMVKTDTSAPSWREYGYRLLLDLVDQDRLWHHSEGIGF